MLGVMNLYIKYGSAGETFKGKCVSGSSSMSTEFAISPAYFDFTSCDEAEREHNESSIDNYIEAKMPLTAQSNEKLFGVIRMCVVTLVYYGDFLKEHLHRNRMARTSIMFVETITVANFLTTKYPWNKTSTTP